MQDWTREAGRGPCIKAGRSERSQGGSRPHALYFDSPPLNP